MPLVSFPAAPASLLKHGEYATYFLGSASPCRISPRCRLVTGTSAVGISHKPSRRVTIRLLGKLRKLARPGHRFPLDQVGDPQFQVSVLRRMQFDHPVDQASLQRRAAALQDIET